MILRLEFDETLDDAALGKQVLLYSVTSHTPLHSEQACRLVCRRLTQECGDRVSFWYVDEGILEEMYFGVEKSLAHLRSFPGVVSVTRISELNTFNPWKIWSNYAGFNLDFYDTHLGRTLLQYV